MKRLNRINEEYSYKSSKGKASTVADDGGVADGEVDETLWLGQNGVEDWGSTIYITDIDYEMKKSELFDDIRRDAADQVHSDRFKVWAKGLKRFRHGGYFEDMEDEDIMKWIKTNPDNLKNYFSVNDPVVYAGGSDTVRLDDWLADREKDEEYDESTKRNRTMKRLNITKEQYNKSRYFKNKYGNLKYVSESGNLFKTDKGQVLKLVKEANENFVLAMMDSVRQFREKLQKCEGEIIELSHYGVTIMDFSASKRKGNFGTLRLGRHWYFGYRLKDGTNLFYDQNEDKFNKMSDEDFVQMVLNDESGTYVDFLTRMGNDAANYIKGFRNRSILDGPSMWESSKPRFAKESIGTEFEGTEFSRGEQVILDRFQATCEYGTDSEDWIDELPESGWTVMDIEYNAKDDNGLDSDGFTYTIANKEVGEELEVSGSAIKKTSGKKFSESSKPKFGKKFAKEASEYEWLNTFKKAQDFVDKACEQLEVVAFEGGADVSNPIHKKLLRIWGEMRDVIGSV